jgi:non-specific serine/threonine protein kinase
MTTVRALEYALDDRAEADPSGEVSPLSRRERDVVALVAAGLTNKQIADRLFIAERTAEGHVERIRNKLGFRSRTEVATWAVQRGIAGGGLDKDQPRSTV